MTAPVPLILIFGDPSGEEPGRYNAWASPGHDPDAILWAARAATPAEALALVCEHLAAEFRALGPTLADQLRERPDAPRAPRFSDEGAR